MTKINDGKNELVKLLEMRTYDNFVEKILICTGGKEVMKDRLCELQSFINSSKFIELLNQYKELKDEYEQL